MSVAYSFSRVKWEHPAPVLRHVTQIARDDGAGVALQEARNGLA